MYKRALSQSTVQLLSWSSHPEMPVTRRDIFVYSRFSVKQLIFLKIGSNGHSKIIPNIQSNTVLGGELLLRRAGGQTMRHV